MTKLKKIHLINFCGYKDFEIDFTDKDVEKEDVVRQWTMISGPNGVGKSNFLHAIRLVANPWQYQSRQDSTLFFRKLTYHPNYLPNYDGFIDHQEDMVLKAEFIIDGDIKKVEVRNTGKKETTGVVINELPADLKTAVFYVDADNPVNYQKFQVVDRNRKPFLDFAQEVYGFDCSLPDDPLTIVEEFDPQVGKHVDFITDFILTKPNHTKVHFKRFSAGEKKIATMLNTLFNFVYGSKENYILLIDNIEQHIYWKRHIKLIEKISEHFNDRQVIATTHSPVIINEIDKKYLLDLEEHVK
jgi:AAA15 family ATPase/GTPase